jgi:hypothetical protein
MATQKFQELFVWQKAHLFVLGVYKYAKNFPKEEVYALSSQFKRAAVSIAANIAQGSLEECQYYLILSQDLGYGENEALRSLLNEVGKMLESYMQKILSSNS